MKKYIWAIGAFLLMFLFGLMLIQRKQIAKYKELYNKELQNVEAYQTTNSSLEGTVRQFQMTLDDLRASKDSLDSKLLEVAEQLKIKDKRIEYLQYQKKIVYSIDTLEFHDTIFVRETHIDTIIGDAWYTLKLQLDYPSRVVTNPTFKSEQYIIINSKKEFNKTPSKFFLIRQFQKKHTIVEVNMEEKSPYIINKENKFIKVLD